MSYPIIEDITPYTAASGTTHDVPYPAVVDVGDLMILVYATDDNETITYDSGTWTAIYNEDAGSQGPTLLALWHIAVGNEDGGTTQLSHTTEGVCAYMFRISGHDSAQAPEATAESTGNSVNPDSLSITPTGGSKDYLILSVATNDDDDSYTGYPANMADNNQELQVATVTMGIATEEVTNSVFDPAQFTIAAGETWEAVTIAVHPAAGATEHVQNMTLETLTLLDTVARQQTLFREYSEVSTLVDTIMKDVSAQIVEVSTLTDSVLLAPVKMLEDIVDIGDKDILHLMAHKEIYTETITLGNSVLKDAAHIIDETSPLGISLTDTVTLQKIYNKTLEDTVNLLDTYERIFTVFRTYSETINLIDTVTRVSTLYKEFLQTITLINPAVDTEYSKGQTAYVQDMNLETLTLLDDYDVLVMRTLSETHALSDSVLRGTFKAPTDAISLDDNYERVFTVFRTYTETLSLIDSSLSGVSKTVSDTLNLDDSIERVFTLFRTLTDAATLTDTDERVFTVFRTFSDKITLIDSVIAIILKIVDLSELISLIDTVPRLFTVYRTLTEISTLGDSIFSTSGKILSDTITLVDSIIPLQVTLVLLNETLTLTDTLFMNVIKVIQNTITLNDTYADNLTLFKIISDTITLADTDQIDMIKVASDTMYLTDTYTRLFTVFRTLSEKMTLIDTLTTTYTGEATVNVKTLTETITLLDTVLYQVDIFRTLIDTISLSDSLVRVTSFYRTYTETISLDDTLETLKVFNRVFSETITLTDIFEIISAVATELTLTETITLSDVAFRMMILDFIESITLIDSIVKIYLSKIIATTRYISLIRKDIVLKIIKHRKV